MYLFAGQRGFDSLHYLILGAEVSYCTAHQVCDHRTTGGPKWTKDDQRIPQEDQNRSEDQNGPNMTREDHRRTETDQRRQKAEENSGGIEGKFYNVYTS